MVVIFVLCFMASHIIYSHACILMHVSTCMYPHACFCSCSYIFHMAFASSFTAVLGMSRWLMMGTRDPERRPRGVVTELVCVVLTGKGSIMCTCM